MEKLTIVLDNFTGPLDLLLFLISKSKINIKDIFLSKITEQYVQIVFSAPSVDYDEVGDFISMATKLIEIKSKYLLPSEEDLTIEEEKEALIQQILVYKQIKQTIDFFINSEKNALLYFEKIPEDYIVENQIVELKKGNISSLANSMISLFQRKQLQAQKKEFKLKLNNVYTETITIKQGINSILKKMQNKPIPLDNIVEYKNREYYITYFLATLELLKLGKIDVIQSGIFSTIDILKRQIIHNDKQ